MTNENISIVIPAKNELAGLQKILPEIRQLYPDYQVIVVDDGSTDATKKTVPRSRCYDYFSSVFKR